MHGFQIEHRARRDVVAVDPSRRIDRLSKEKQMKMPLPSDSPGCVRGEKCQHGLPETLLRLKLEAIARVRGKNVASE